MSKKNKNKGKNNPQTQSKATAQTTPKIPVLSDEQKLDIETLDKATTKTVFEQGLSANSELSSEATAKLQESEAKNDLPKYWTFVKEINRKLETLISKTEEEKGKTEKLNSDLQTSIKENENAKASYIKKLEEYNKKDKELTEREFALDNGEYTGIIKRLLDSIKETEKTVFTDTENLLKDLKKFHKENIEEFSTHLQENTEFETEKSKFKREKEKFECEKKFFKEDTRAEYESKYSEDLTVKSSELEKLTRQFDKLQSENEKLNHLIEDIKAAFNVDEPREMVNEYSLLKEELSNVQKELNERPEKADYDAKVAQIDELKAKVTEYQAKVKEGELLELKRILNNQDNYIIEINGYKTQIESAKVREQSLQKTVADLQVTIDQLKGESAKKEDAFEFAKKCDADNTNLGRNQLDNKNTPSDLKALVEYTQQRMAFRSDKPFYYSVETIRTFLAGLYMSPISILQGISGTGKTSLPREFAKALLSDTNYIGINSADNTNNAPYRICAVQSGWRDNMDLMGYYNSFEHKYKETDFFKALYLANQSKYSDTLFFIILDEMNLSRPEHYFAGFLSLLEQSASERYINLTNTPEKVLPSLIKGGKLRVPENVRFIGTANHDETTLEFAPKTYDRSNLMEMPKNHPKITNNNKTDSFNVTYSWLKQQFESAEKAKITEYEKFIKFINSDDIQMLLMEKGIGTGNRLEDQAKRFIGVYLAADGKLSEAVDHLVTSRLLRTLKNRYDLDKANITAFKDDYVKAFKNTFKEKDVEPEPKLAKELLDTEISKK
jgi:hypothetical protein